MQVQVRTQQVGPGISMKYYYGSQWQKNRESHRPIVAPYTVPAIVTSSELCQERARRKDYISQLNDKFRDAREKTLAKSPHPSTTCDNLKEAQRESTATAYVSAT